MENFPAQFGSLPVPFLEGYIEWFRIHPVLIQLWMVPHLPIPDLALPFFGFGSDLNQTSEKREIYPGGYFLHPWSKGSLGSTRLR